MPVVMATTVRRIKQEVKIRRSQSMLPKGEPTHSAYKSVPTPKSLTNGSGVASSGPGTVAAAPPPPYRQPPLPADPASSGSVTAANGPTTAATSAGTGNVIHHADCTVLDGHALLAYSSKFPIERELVVTTSDKIADVGRIEVPTATNSTPPAAAPPAASAAPAAPVETNQTEMAPTVTAVNQNWPDRSSRHLGDVGVASHYGTYGPGPGVADGTGHGHHLGHMTEEMHRPASYMPMHVHYTGWTAQNNYVAMNGSYDHHQQQQRSLNGMQDTSLSFDTSGPLRLDPVFAPAPTGVPPGGISSSLTQYEIRVDSADRPSTVTVAPWNNGDASDTSTFDRLRDTCNKMFLRDGHLRGSSQFALSPNLPRALEHLTIETDETNGPPSSEGAATSASSVDVKSGEPETKSGGSMRKKLAGKTYHSIKDMFTTKFSGKSAKNKTNGVDDVTEGSAEAKAQRPVDAAAKCNERPVDSIHSINQRIHSQLSSQNQSQVWGSYGRSAKLETNNSTLNDVDTSALAKLTLNSTQETPNSPFSLRHQKPSVTFRMDLNECQYNGSDNMDANHLAPYRTTQGQVILYDDTMHFPQQQQPAQVKDLKSYGEHDSSMSSITSAPLACQKRPNNFTYGDYDIPPNKGSLNSTLSPTEGLSSGHQSAGSSSDLDKRSGQSVSTCDSGLGVNAALDNGRSRSAVYQGLQLDTSTETDVFVGRQVSSQVHNHEWMNEAVDREVKTAMEAQSDQQPSSRSRNFAGRLNTSAEQPVGELQSVTPPLPPLSPECSPKATPKLEHKFSNSKPDLLEPTSGSNGFGQRNNQSKQSAAHAGNGGNGGKSSGVNSSAVTGTSAAAAHRSSSEGKTSDHRPSKRRSQHEEKASKHQTHAGSKCRSKMAPHPLTALQEALDLGEITSTNTGLELDLDSDSNSSQSEEHSDDDLSTTLDVTTESRTIRRQLEGLESMYSEVLKALHKKSRSGGGATSGAPTSDYKLSKRRMYGSVSSLPSSVCSRPVYRDRRRNDDRQRRNASKESKSVNKRFQRLESHVVTLARSVAHLSSEMRTQHIMIQEMETIRNEIAQLRTHPLRMSSAGASMGAGGAYGKASRHHHRLDRDSCWQGAVPALTDPSRVKKLTSFFGDEPPLLRIFLKKLGYEKYAPLFDQEKIGMIELPYLTEERLHKMGIPMGPRIRILQEAQLSQSRGSDSLSVYGIV